MEKRPCSYQGKCKTLTEVDTSFDIPGMGAIATKWCDYHESLYRAESKILEGMIAQYNKKMIKNKFGRIIKFSHHSDVSNYLYQHDKKALKKINQKAEKMICR